MSKTKIVKITRKGQITIPAIYRKKLNHDLVEIHIENDRLIIRPVQDLGGIFNDYAIKDKPIEEVIEIEKKIAKEAFSNGQTNNN